MTAPWTRARAEHGATARGRRKLFAGRGRVLPGTPPPIPGDSASARNRDRAHRAMAIAAKAISKRRTQSCVRASRRRTRSGQAQWQLGLDGVWAARLRGGCSSVRSVSAMGASWRLGARRRPIIGPRARGLRRASRTASPMHLEAAADRPWTFYGQLAEAQLGRDSGLSFEAPQVDGETLAALHRALSWRPPGRCAGAARATL